MKKLLFAALLVCALVSSAWAQRISRVTSGLDVGTGFATNEFAPSLLYYQAISPRNLPWFQISAGMRVWSYFGNDASLAAPSGTSRDDVMRLSRVTATGANFMVGVNFHLAQRIDLGVNTDLFGIAFGKRRNAIYSLGNPLTAPDSIRTLNGTEIGIAPTNLNAIPSLYRPNNGQTEAFLRIWITQRVGIKLGYVVGRIAYRSDNALNNGQKRFSFGYEMPYISAAFPLYN